MRGTSEARLSDNLDKLFCAESWREGMVKCVVCDATLTNDGLYKLKHLKQHKLEYHYMKERIKTMEFYLSDYLERKNDGVCGEGK
jgi:hypothetical protein